ncbi:MAG: carbon monoxide dehydrogenase subunit G [Novosphingobium sp.]
MEMAGERRIAAAPQRVWDALNDPDILRQCIPGCQSLEKEADDRFIAVAEIKIGPIGARFKGAVALTELDPPNGYTISGQGNGGVAGNAKGTAKVRLSADGAGTLLAYTVDAQVGGRMAQLGGPLIDATARNMADKFFTNFGEVVGGGAVAAGHAVAEPSLTAPKPVAQVAPVPVPLMPSSQGFPWAWAIALGVAIVGGFLLGRSSAAEWWVIAMGLLALVSAGAGFESGRRSGGRS